MCKRIGILLLVLAVGLCLAACGGQDMPRVGVCLRQAENSMTAEAVTALDEAMEQAGYQVQTLDAGMDQTRQNRQIAELMDEGCDLLMVEPVMVSAGADIAAMAEQAGVPVIFFGREPDQAVLASSEKLCYVGFDPAAPGALQSGLLQQTPDNGDINSDGVVSYYVIGGPEDDLDTRLRTAGFVEGLAQAGLQAQCIGSSWGDWSRQSGERIATKALAQWGKDLEVLVCNSDELAIGALEAIADGGRTVGRDLYLLGIDGSRHAQVLIRSGEMTGTVAQDLQAQAARITELADRLLQGGEVEKIHYVDYVTLTGENIEDYMSQ